MKAFLGKETGSISTMAVVALVGISLLVLSQLGNRAQNELEREQHSDLLADKLQVKAAIKSVALCPKNLPKTCTPGQRLRLVDDEGEEIVSTDGSRRISRWNVKIECNVEKGKALWVYVARLNGEGFQNDPLTKKPLDWAELSALNEACGNDSNSKTKLLGNICYGALQGTRALPKELQSRCGAGCTFVGKYCGDDQIPFPTCPKGFHVAFRYVDRYGWGGIDLTKYSLCRQNT